jgi:hypothetical protein
MKNKPEIDFLIYKKTLLIILLLSLSSLVFSQITLINPGIPLTESISYNQIVDGVVESIKVEVESVNEDNNHWLEYRTFSREQEVFIKFDPDNLTAFYSEVWDKKADSTVHSITQIIENKKIVKDNELLITDMYGFLLSLRGFPWEEENSAEIVFLNGSSDFKLDLKIKGKETLQIDDKTYECWKVQIGMGGIMGAIFPKSYYWYTINAPHFLIRSEGSGMPRNPKTILEIKSYSSK